MCYFQDDRVPNTWTTFMSCRLRMCACKWLFLLLFRHMLMNEHWKSIRSIWWWWGRWWTEQHHNDEQEDDEVIQIIRVELTTYFKYYFLFHYGCLMYTRNIRILVRPCTRYSSEDFLMLWFRCTEQSLMLILVKTNGTHYTVCTKPTFLDIALQFPCIFEDIAL